MGGAMRKHFTVAQHMSKYITVPANCYTGKMLNRYRCLVALGIASSAASGIAIACEDDHPPVVTTPVETFRLRGQGGGEVLKVAFDPRGMGAVVPDGDDGDPWIDTNDSTGAWHYREWQWWKGHPWGDSCRPRFYSDVTFHASHDIDRRAVISYRIDGFECRQVFLLPQSAEDRNAPYWDLVTTIRNVSGHDVEEYGHFFACYTPLNRGRSFWYWDESGELVRFADRHVTHLDGYVAHPRAYFLKRGTLPHCPRGGGRIVARWRRPVMVSQASPAGWRSILMIEANYAASLAQGLEGGAMDYVLFPGPDQQTFAAGSEYSTHMRHILLKSPQLPTVERLDGLWDVFQEAHAKIRERAANR
jgi:hypothetical protein